MAVSFNKVSTLGAMALLSLAVAACSNRSEAPTPPPPAPAPVAAQPVAPQAPAELKRIELGYGVYELAYSPAKQSVYAATAQLTKGVTGGVIYQLDPATLAVTGQIHTDLKNFALTTDASGETLFVTNSLDGGLSRIDLRTGKVEKRLKFNEMGRDGHPVNPRQVILHDGMLYVGGVGDPGVIWVVDAKTLTLKARIPNAGKWVTGLLYSEDTGRLYAANGSGEVLVINPRTRKIEHRWTPGDGGKYLLLNLAEDRANHQLFVTDNSEAKTVLVFDIRTGKVIKRLPVGDALAIKLNTTRNELYITQRETGRLLILDATTYAEKKAYDLKPNPNSLLVSPDGQTLYATVKTPFDKEYMNTAPESVVRIDLSAVK